MGTRNAQKALLYALLEPNEQLKSLQDSASFTEKMVRMEQMKTMPFGDIWEHYCELQGVPNDVDWFEEVRRYENDVLLKRG